MIQTNITVEKNYRIVSRETMDDHLSDETREEIKEQLVSEFGHTIVVSFREVNYICNKTRRMEGI